jgi:hypothetical protein
LNLGPSLAQSIKKSKLSMHPVKEDDGVINQMTALAFLLGSTIHFQPN